MIRVRNTTLHITKGKLERYIPVADKIKKMITIWMSRPGVYLFTTDGIRQFNEDYLSKGFKKIIINLPLSNEIHVHTLRHSFASYLAIHGVSLYVVKELLGHKDISTTQSYAELIKRNNELGIPIPAPGTGW